MLKQSLEFSVIELYSTLESKVRNIINVRIFKNLRHNYYLLSKIEKRKECLWLIYSVLSLVWVLCKKCKENKLSWVVRYRK